MMRYKLLGRSGLRVSELALGTMTFGEGWGFGASEETCQEVFRTYTEAGGNFIDTANKYTNGHSEEIVGRCVKGERQRYVIATKYTLNTDGTDPNAGGNHRKNMVQACEASLKRLGTDYIDLYWVHAWDGTTPVDEVMRGLDDLVSQGKILYIGVSDTPAWVVSQANTLAALRGWNRFVALQIEYSLLERTVERELIPMAEAFGLALTPWAAMAGGVLTGKYTRDASPQDTTRAGMNQGRLSDRNLAIAREVDAVADELGAQSAQVALSWVRQQGSNVIPVVGARKPSQLASSLGCLDLTLPEEMLARLDAVSAIELGFPHDFLGQPGIQKILYGDDPERLDR